MEGKHGPRLFVISLQCLVQCNITFQGIFLSLVLDILRAPYKDRLIDHEIEKFDIYFLRRKRSSPPPMGY